jgi:uncharacterized phage protein gp47/JayE
MDFSTEGILERMKLALKNEDSRIEGSFSMDNLQAVAEEAAKIYALTILPIKEELASRKDNLSTSGNERHYVQWAKEVVNSAGETVIGNARAHGARDGSGTVYVALVSKTAEKPSEEVLELVSSYIQSKRPVGANPIILAAEGIEIQIKGLLRIKQGFDLTSIYQQAELLIRKYFTEIAFQSPEASVEMNYYRIGIILSAIPGVADIIGYTVNGEQNSIIAEYDKYFSLKGLVLNGG